LFRFVTRRDRQINIQLRACDLQNGCAKLSKQTSAKRHARPVRPF
jgi:hypothetical protein